MSEPRILRAGPLQVSYQNGELRDLRLGQTEVLRRVYGAVRDRDWGTVAAHISEEQIADNGDYFRVEFAARHRQNEIEFDWRGVIVGERDGTVSFEFDGRALRDFWRNRIGLCVLHPPDCAGVAARTHAEGARQSTRFPLHIAPHCPFENLSALSYQLAPDLWARVEFEGEVFETEDQRNWTDASFKTYGTPLALPFPVQVAAGARVAQRVTLRFEGALPPFAPFRPKARVTVARGAALGALPPLGLCFSPASEPLDAQILARLRALAPAHLRVEVDLTRDFAPDLTRALVQSQQLDCALEIALLGGEFGDEAALDAAIVSLQNARVASVCLFADRTQTVAPDAFARAQRRLRAALANVPVGAGSNANFAEFNRQRPPQNADFGAYAANPQVHAFDDQSLLETPVALGQTLRSARAILGAKAVKIAPLTLKPRFNAVATALELDALSANTDALPANAGALPANADARQFSVLGAVWTLASLVALLEAGLGTRAGDGLTLFETHGPRGVVSEAGAPSPIWFLWSELAQARGATALAISTDDPSLVGLALGERVLLANLSAQPRQIAFVGLNAEFEIGGYEVGFFSANQKSATG